MELKPSTRATASFRKVPTLPLPARRETSSDRGCHVVFSMSFMSYGERGCIIQHTFLEALLMIRCFFDNVKTIVEFGLK